MINKQFDSTVKTDDEIFHQFLIEFSEGQDAVRKIFKRLYKLKVLDSGKIKMLYVCRDYNLLLRLKRRPTHIQKLLSEKYDISERTIRRIHERHKELL